MSGLATPWRLPLVSGEVVTSWRDVANASIVFQYGDNPEHRVEIPEYRAYRSPRSPIAVHRFIRRWLHRIRAYQQAEEGA